MEYVAEAYPNFLGVSFVHDTFSRPGLEAPAALGPGRLSGLALNLGHADDSFTNYEHPTPIILKKVHSMDEGAIRTLLETPLAGESVRAPPTPGIPERGMLSEESAARQQAGGTFSDIFDRGSFANRFPTFVWYIAVQIIALAALPIGLLLFSRLPDRGYLLTKVLGLLFVGYLAWLLASLRILDFSPGGLWLMIVVVAAVSGILVWRGRVGVVDFFPAAMAANPLLRGVVPRRFPLFLRRPGLEPRPLAAVARRRETHGLRLPQCRHQVDRDAPLRPLVCRRSPQLLLLRPVPNRFADQDHWACCHLRPSTWL